MNPGEHALMARVEAQHWWYQGLRDVIGRTLARPELALPAAPAVLDAGCGTGETLRFLATRFEASYLGGFDASEEGLELAREKVPSADLYASDLCDPEIHCEALDLVLSLDVLSITGVDAARGGLARLVSHLRPGGLLLLHLPAYDWLRSEHDVAVHNQERFTRRRVRALMSELGLDSLRDSYRMSALLPAVVATRAGSLLREPDPSVARSQLHDVPSAALNGLLRGIVTAENYCVARGFRVPFGSSVFALGRKP